MNQELPHRVDCSRHTPCAVTDAGKTPRFGQFRHGTTKKGTRRACYKPGKYPVSCFQVTAVASELEIAG
jgi:hypothetical protein